MPGMIAPKNIKQYKTKPYPAISIDDTNSYTNGPKKDITEVMPSDHARGITVSGKIHKIYPPIDNVQPTEYQCPCCGSNEATKYPYLVDEIRRNSIDYKYDLGILSEQATDKDIPKNLNSILCRTCWYDDGSVEEMYPKHTFEYTSQFLEMVDDDLTKTVNVIYISENKALTKKDVGCDVSVRGTFHYDDETHEYGLVSADIKKIIPSDEEPEPVEHSRDIPGYDEWRQTVISRDKECVVCGGTKHLNAHHIYGYKEYPNLRTDTNNGVSVCKFCHDKYHSYYGIKEITPIKFIQFLRQFMVR